MDNMPVFIFKNKPWLFSDYKNDPMKFNDSLFKIESTYKETDFSTNVGLKNNGTFYGHKYKKEED